MVTGRAFGFSFRRVCLVVYFFSYGDAIETFSVAIRLFLYDRCGIVILYFGEMYLVQINHAV